MLERCYNTTVQSFSHVQNNDTSQAFLVEWSGRFLGRKIALKTNDDNDDIDKTQNMIDKTIELCIKDVDFHLSNGVTCCKYVFADSQINTCHVLKEASNIAFYFLFLDSSFRLGIVFHSKWQLEC